MKKRLFLLAGLGVGYVLGSRTGRQSYEKLKAQAQDLWTSPRVQDTVEKANQTIREKSPAVADAVQTATDKANTAATGNADTSGGSSSTAKTDPKTAAKQDVITDPERSLEDEGPAAAATTDD